jgi:L-seryl-tRNA(Ser) seleniumtransferase
VGFASDGARKSALLRSLPSIDALLSQPSLHPILAEHPRPRKVAALRLAVERVRERLLNGEERGFEEDDLRSALRELTTPGLRRVFNATGVVLHTNLGRAPLAQSAASRVAALATVYANLEFDLADGERGSRYAPLQGLLQALTGAEAAVVVNNNAASVLVVLAALAQGGEVVVSRGELVEIGGGFRIPDVMLQSGAQLVEVGTTNRTRLADYERALTPKTRLLMKVHQSNFAQIGFTEDVTTGALAKLGRTANIPVFEDLGSGALMPFPGDPGGAEPTVQSAISAGADLVSFSGDKLLGGPQAGIVVGKKTLIDRIAAHPLNRAVRVDKMTVAALEATLELYRDGRCEEIPAYRLLRQGAAELQARAERLQQMLGARGIATTIQRTEGQVGGGAMPRVALVSYACALQSSSPLELQTMLRRGEPALITRVSENQVLIDVQCLDDQELEGVAEVVTSQV